MPHAAALGSQRTQGFWLDPDLSLRGKLFIFKLLTQKEKEYPLLTILLHPGTFHNNKLPGLPHLKQFTLLAQH